MKSLLIAIALFTTLLSGVHFAKEHDYSAKNFPKHMSLKEKKERFFALMVPAVEDVYNKLYKQYLLAKKDIKENTHPYYIAALKMKYKVKTDKELLIALKPHPVSITLAQAAMESAWGTSRLFRKANNVFGIHGRSSKGSIPSAVKKGGRTVWVRKYKNIEDSIKSYYYMLSTGKSYRKFKRLNYEDRSVFEIIKGLKYYSELGDVYVHRIASIIRHNNLTKYDTKVAK